VPCSPFVECRDARPSPFVGAGVVGVVGRVRGWWGGVLGRYGRWSMRSSLHAGERTVRHAHAELMREQQTTTHTLTNTLNTLSLTVRARMLRIRGLKVLENTQMFCIIEFHFIDLSLRIFNTKFVLL
jgi:hypothetical protein